MLRNMSGPRGVSVAKLRSDQPPSVMAAEEKRKQRSFNASDDRKRINFLMWCFVDSFVLSCTAEIMFVGLE